MQLHLFKNHGVYVYIYDFFSVLNSQMVVEYFGVETHKQEIHSLLQCIKNPEKLLVIT